MQEVRLRTLSESSQFSNLPVQTLVNAGVPYAKNPVSIDKVCVM